MAGRFSKPGSLYGRFLHVPHLSGPVVYVAEFSNGVVKVGFTSKARQRLACCLTEARRAFGRVELVRFHATHAFRCSITARNAEKRALSCIEKVATRPFPAVRYTEYFAGISFEDAARIADSCLPTEAGAA